MCIVAAGVTTMDNQTALAVQSIQSMLDPQAVAEVPGESGQYHKDFHLSPVHVYSLSVSTGPLANGQWKLVADQWHFKLLAQIG